MRAVIEEQKGYKDWKKRQHSLICHSSEHFSSGTSKEYSPFGMLCIMIGEQTLGCVSLEDKKTKLVKN